MKRISLLAGTALLIAAGAAFAAAGDKPQGAPGPGMGGPGMIEQIDTNKDGIITAQEAQAARAAHFDKMDANKDGFVDKDEMKAAWKDHGMGGRHGDHGMMKGADANKDGKLTKAEFTAGAGARFDKMDKNKDGVLDQTDRAGKDGKGHKGGRLAELDTNKDGKLSKAEFMAKDPMFEHLDTNNDGKLDKTELDAARMHGPEGGPPPAQ